MLLVHPATAGAHLGHGHVHGLATQGLSLGEHLRRIETNKNKLGTARPMSDSCDYEHVLIVWS